MSELVSGFGGASSAAMASAGNAATSVSSDASLAAFESLMATGAAASAPDVAPPFFGADERAIADIENAAPDHSGTSASSSTFAYSVTAGANSARTAYPLSGTKMDGARSQMLSSAESRIVSNLLNSMGMAAEPASDGSDTDDGPTQNTTTRFYAET